MRRIIRQKERNKDDLNINITPFIDIIFCVLVAFMVPNQNPFGRVNIELPPVNAKIAVLERDPVKVIIQQNRNIYVNDKDINGSSLIASVDEASLKNRNIKVYVMADKKNNYGDILSVLKKLSDSGYVDVVLISDAQNRL